MSDWIASRWGDQGEAEVLHRHMLRRCFKVWQSTPGVFLLDELGRVPMMHSWFKRCIGWWNNIMCRDDEDVVRVCLCESVRQARSGQVNWAWHFLEAVKKVDDVSYNMACGCITLQSNLLMEKLWAAWNGEAWTLLRQFIVHLEENDLDYTSATVRDIPEKLSKGFKFFTFAKWFAAHDIEDRRSFVMCVSDPCRIGMLARFCFGAHGLMMERGRHICPKMPRSRRVCPCCDFQEREDELHLFQCPAYESIRLQYANTLYMEVGYSTDASGWTDDQFRMFVNRKSRAAWNQLADMLIRITERRRMIMSECV